MGKTARVNLSRSGRFLLVALGMTMLLVGCFGAQEIWAGGMTMHPALGLFAGANAVMWCFYLATSLREGIHADTTARVEALREEIREAIRTEVANLLKPVESQLEEIDHEVGDYGDRRQAEGAALALQQIVGQRGKNVRHLTPVE